MFTSENGILERINRHISGYTKVLAHNPVMYQNSIKFLIERSEPVEPSLDKREKDTFRLYGSMKDSGSYLQGVPGDIPDECGSRRRLLEVDKRDHLVKTLSAGFTELNNILS